MSEISQELLLEFMNAAVDDHPKALQMLAKQPGLRNARRAHIEETALHYLAVESHCDAVRFLAKNGFEVNTKSADGSTPLMNAALLGDVPMANLLLSLGADPNAISDTWDYVLCAGVFSGSDELVKTLLSAGADPNVVRDTFTWRDYLPDDQEKRARVLAVMSDFGVSI